MLGMSDTRYVEPTGLSSRNQSSARDLATLVNAATSTRSFESCRLRRSTRSRSAAASCSSATPTGWCATPRWDIGLQKTGYISEAGRCLVMQAKLAGRKLIMVFLDSAGKYSRIGDAERVRRWITEHSAVGRAAVRPRAFGGHAAVVTGPDRSARSRRWP